MAVARKSLVVGVAGREILAVVAVAERHVLEPNFTTQVTGIAHRAGTGTWTGGTLTVLSNAMGVVLPRLKDMRADVFCVGSPEAVAGATTGIALPEDVPEDVSPMLEILPFQQLALHLAVARGCNPDSPRGLRKVTETL